MDEEGPAQETPGGSGDDPGEQPLFPIGVISNMNAPQGQSVEDTAFSALMSLESLLNPGTELQDPTVQDNTTSQQEPPSENVPSAKPQEEGETGESVIQPSSETGSRIPREGNAGESRASNDDLLAEIESALQERSPTAPPAAEEDTVPGNTSVAVTDVVSDDVIDDVSGALDSAHPESSHAEENDTCTSLPGVPSTPHESDNTTVGLPSNVTTGCQGPAILTEATEPGEYGIPRTTQDNENAPLPSIQGDSSEQTDVCQGPDVIKPPLAVTPAEESQIAAMATDTISLAALTEPSVDEPFESLELLTNMAPGSISLASVGDDSLVSAQNVMEEGRASNVTTPKTCSDKNQDSAPIVTPSPEVSEEGGPTASLSEMGISGENPQNLPLNDTPQTTAEPEPRNHLDSPGSARPHSIVPEEISLAGITGDGTSAETPQKFDKNPDLPFEMECEDNATASEEEIIDQNVCESDDDIQDHDVIPGQGQADADMEVTPLTVAPGDVMGGDVTADDDDVITHTRDDSPSDITEPADPNMLVWNFDSSAQIKKEPDTYQSAEDPASPVVPTVFIKQEPVDDSFPPAIINQEEPEDVKPDVAMLNHLAGLPQDKDDSEYINSDGSLIDEDVCPPHLKEAYQQMRQASARPRSHHRLFPAAQPPRSSSVGSDSSAQSSMSGVDTGGAWSLENVCTKHPVCQSALHKHLISFERRHHPFRCDPCAMKFYCTQEQDAHNMSQHPMELSGDIFGQPGMGPPSGDIGGDAWSATPEKHRCPICGKDIATERGLKQHITIKHRSGASPSAASHTTYNSEYMGPDVDGASKSPRSRLHPDQDPASGPATCSICNKRFDTFHGLKIHSQIMHRQKPAETQRTPSTETRSTPEKSLGLSPVRVKVEPVDLSHLPGNLTLSPREHRDFQPGRKGNGPRVCKICGMGTQSIQGLRRHEKHAHGIIHIYPCPGCNQRFTNTNRRADHLPQCPDPHVKSKPLTHHIEHIKPTVKFRKILPKPSSGWKNADVPLPSEPGVYRCDICKRAYPTAFSLKQHRIHRHRISYDYPCKLCKSRFTRSRDLQDHIKTAHSQRGPYNYKSNTAISAAPSPSYTCNWCRQQFRTTEELKLHKTRDHGAGAAGSKSDYAAHVCNWCGKTFSAACDLKSHKICEHGAVYTSTCKQCGEKFDSQSLLLKHHLAVHSSEPAQREPEPVGINERRRPLIQQRSFPCSLCERVFPNPRALKWHRNKKHGIRLRFKCSTCCMKFETPELLLEHKQDNHCGRRAPKPQHQSSVEANADGKFECPKCSRAFGTLRNMRFHMTMMHNTEKRAKPQQLYANSSGPVQCLICNKRFQSQHVLKIHHGRMHKNEEVVDTYKCDYCRCRFASNDDLQGHISMAHPQGFGAPQAATPAGHSGAASLACVTCSRVFTNAYSLKMHRVRAHGVVLTKVCSICGYKFENKETLAQHVQETHTVQPQASAEEDGDVMISHVTKAGETVMETPEKTAPSDGGDAEPIVSSSSLDCAECSTTFSTPFGLKMHMINKHKMTTSHECTICTNRFFTQAELDAHIREKHTVISPKAPAIKSPPSATTTTTSATTTSTTGESHLQCHVCWKSFLHMKGLVGHEVSVHRKKYLHHCNICGKGFDRINELNEHTPKCVAHHPDAVPTRPKVTGEHRKVCRTCGRDFQTMTELLDHELNFHSYNWPFRCNICGKGYNSAPGVDYHLKAQHPSGPGRPAGQSPSPSRPVGRPPKSGPKPIPASPVAAEPKPVPASPTAVPRPVPVQDNTTSSSGKDLKCGQCGEEMPTPLLLKMHLKVHMVHAVGKVFKCLVCFEKYDTIQSFDQHIKSHKSNNAVVTIKDSDDESAKPAPPPEPEREPPAQPETEKPADKKKRKYVYTSDQPERPIKCNVCPKGFTNVTTRNKHCRQVHGVDPPLENVKASYRKVGDVETRVKPHKCPHCPRSFKSRAQLGYHMRKHREVESDDSMSSAESDSEVPPPAKMARVTSSAGSSSSSASNVSSAPSECLMCRKTFPSREKMEQHRRVVHSGERPFQCPHCDRSYFVQSVLTAHIRGEHPGE